MRCQAHNAATTTHLRPSCLAASDTSYVPGPGIQAGTEAEKSVLMLDPMEWEAPVCTTDDMAWAQGGGGGGRGGGGDGVGRQSESDCEFNSMMNR